MSYYIVNGGNQCGIVIMHAEGDMTAIATCIVDGEIVGCDVINAMDIPNILDTYSSLVIMESVEV